MQGRIVQTRGLLTLVHRCYGTLHGLAPTTNTKPVVRVRFAPSPTGHLHLGGLRTALYNYLYARAWGGTFVLRIDDTDSARLVAGAVAALERDLEWAGIPPDESPSKGGPYEPYQQSERLHLYWQHVESLLQSGAAYRCFCTEHRLALLRRDALRTGQNPRYDNHCRDLHDTEAKALVAKGKPYCIRFKLQADVKTFMDLTYGPVMYDVSAHEGDPVILKSDGYPTYHLAHVVDDRAMRITHVLRGVEWQMSTIKHLQIYRALGWDPPAYAHLPLLLNADGSKLSKRQGDILVKSCRDDGIFPLALVNFVTSMGGGFVRKKEAESPAIYPLDELVKQFNPKKVNQASCRLALQRLPEFNALEIRRQLEDEERVADMVQAVREMVSAAYRNRREDHRLMLDDDYIRSVLHWSRWRIQRLSDLVGAHLAFLWVVPQPSTSSATLATCKEGHAVELLTSLTRRLDAVAPVDYQRLYLRQLMTDFARQHHVKFSDLMVLLRMALSGSEEGPGVAEMMEVLGPHTTGTRLQMAAEVLAGRRGVCDEGGATAV